MKPADLNPGFCGIAVYLPILQLKGGMSCSKYRASSREGRAIAATRQQKNIAAKFALEPDAISAPI